MSQGLSTARLILVFLSWVSFGANEEISKYSLQYVEHLDTVRRAQQS